MFSQLKTFNSRLNYGLVNILKHPQITIITNNIHYIVQNQPCNLLLPRSFGLLLKQMGTSTTIKTIDYEIVKAVKESSTLLIDVREPTELINTGTLPASVNIPLSDVENALKDMGELEFRTKYGQSKPTCDTPIIFSCQSGKRSHKAANMAISLGYTNISNYGGGWLDWEAKTKK